MGKFIVILLIIYVIYYGINILYDGFLKKEPVKEENEGEEIMFDEFQETPQKITVDDIDVPQGNSAGGEEYKIQPNEASIINGEVQDQGIEVNSFIGGVIQQVHSGSKNMFAGVSFN